MLFKVLSSFHWTLLQDLVAAIPAPPWASRLVSLFHAHGLCLHCSWPQSAQMLHVQGLLCGCHVTRSLFLLLTLSTALTNTAMARSLLVHVVHVSISYQ